MPTQCLKNDQNSPIPCRKKEEETLNLNHHLQCLHPKSIRPRPYSHRYVPFTHHTIWCTNFQFQASSEGLYYIRLFAYLQNGFAILLNCFVCKIKKFGVNIECGYYEFFIGHILGRVSFVAYLDYSSAISTSEKH